MKIEKLIEILPELSASLHFDFEETLPYFERGRSSHFIDIDYDQLSPGDCLKLVQMAITERGNKFSEPSIVDSGFSMAEISPRGNSNSQNSLVLPKLNSIRPLIDLVETLEDKKIMNRLSKGRELKKKHVFNEFKKVVVRLIQKLPEVFKGKPKKVEFLLKYFEHPMKKQPDEPDNSWRLRCHLVNTQKFVTSRDILAICQCLELTNQPKAEKEHFLKCSLDRNEDLSNTDKIHLYVSCNKDSIQKLWHDETPLSSSGKLSVMDLMPFLRDAFLLNDLKILESKSNPKDFFYLPNSYTSFMKLLEEYIYKFLRIDPEFFSFEDYLLEFDEICFFVDWWLNKDQNLIVSYYNSGQKETRKSSLSSRGSSELALKSVLFLEEMSKDLKILPSNVNEVKEERDAKEERDLETIKSIKTSKSNPTTKGSHSKNNGETKEKALKESFVYFCKNTGSNSEKKRNSLEEKSEGILRMLPGDFIDFCTAFKIKSKEFPLPVHFPSVSPSAYSQN